VALSSSTTNTVTISGTPDTVAQGLAFTVKVTDSASQSASQSYTVSILLEPDTLTLSSPSLSFAPQLTGTPSGVLAETVTNTGALAVVISGVALAGTNAADFSQHSTCGSSLAAGANCTINVTFTPSQLGPRSGSIRITDNTAGSPHSFSLGGVGLTSGPNTTWSATSLTFAAQPVGATSPAQSITLSNYGTAALSIAGIAATANFGESDTCGSSLASGASCSTINVTFMPSLSGSLNGTLSATDNAPASPQTLSLSGVGLTSGANTTWSATSLTFADQPVGTTSPAQFITLSNYGTTTLSIAGIAASVNFGDNDYCSSSLASGASCQIGVTFAPSSSGSLSGMLSVTDNGPGSPQTISLVGTGIANPHPLTGSCVGINPNNKFECSYGSSSSCPAGQPAKTLATFSCFGTAVLVDSSRGCGFQVSGQLVTGECVAK
jgi:hypothetical protein